MEMLGTIEYTPIELHSISIYIYLIFREYLTKALE